MSLIDQRVTIAAPAEAVWSFVANPALLPRWQKGCKQVSLLSTRPAGIGSRRRITDESGNSVVEEITHWLENLGYEYVMIDGPFKSFRGRLRLQAVPEGTIVTWTIEYTLRGALSGIRNAFGYRGRAEAMMADSLKALRRLVEGSGARIDPDRQARVAMRHAPSAEARAEIAARVTAQRAESDEAAAQSTMAATVPKPPPEIKVPDMGEPSFVAKLSTSELPAIKLADEKLKGVEASLADTKPRRPKGLDEAIAAAQKSPSDPKRSSREMPAIAAAPPPTEPETWDPEALTVPVDLVAPPPPPQPESEPTVTLEITPAEQRPVTPKAFPDTLPEQVPTPKAVALPPELKPRPPVAVDPRKTPPSGVPKVQPRPEADAEGLRSAKLPPPTSKGDTGEISIWEVFGLMSPSERTRTDLQAIVRDLRAQPGGSAAGKLAGVIARQAFKRRSAVKVRVHRHNLVQGRARLRARCRANLRVK